MGTPPEILRIIGQEREVAMRKALIAVAVLISILCANSLLAQEAVQTAVAPKKVQADTNFDGVVDRIESYNSSGQIEKTEADTNGDGKMDEWITYEGGKPLKSQKDTNADGKPDLWVDY